VPKDLVVDLGLNPTMRANNFTLNLEMDLSVRARVDEKE